MVTCHGSQCGFCTPGFVMALAGRTEQKGTDLRTSLTGNLCRCTGYVAILEAAAAIDEDAMPAIADQYPVARIAADLRAGLAEPVGIESRASIFFAPRTLEAAIDFKTRHPSAAIVAGGTELGVVRNKAGLEPAAILRLGNVPELDRIDVNERNGDDRRQRHVDGGRRVREGDVARVPSHHRPLRFAADPQRGDDDREHRQRFADRRLAAVPRRDGGGARFTRPGRFADGETRRFLPWLQGEGSRTERDHHACPHPASSAGRIAEAVQGVAAKRSRHRDVRSGDSHPDRQAASFAGPTSPMPGWRRRSCACRGPRRGCKASRGTSRRSPRPAGSLEARSRRSAMCAAPAISAGSSRRTFS